MYMKDQTLELLTIKFTSAPNSQVYAIKGNVFTLTGLTIEDAKDMDAREVQPTS